MAFGIVAHTIASSSNQNNVTTSSIDTSGASLLVLACGDYFGSTASTITDSKSNTWTSLTVYHGVAVPRLTFFYVKNPTVGSGHTFTATGTLTFPAIAVIAASSADLSSPFDVENGNVSDSPASQPGSITPTLNNELVVTAAILDGAGDEATSIDSGFTISDHAANQSGLAFGLSMAYLIQTTATSENPTWSGSGNTNGAIIASFKVAAAASGKPWLYYSNQMSS